MGEPEEWWIINIARKWEFDFLGNFLRKILLELVFVVNMATSSSLFSRGKKKTKVFVNVIKDLQLGRLS